LLGSGSGFFPLFNRNKKSIAVNLKHEEGRAIVEKLLGNVDVVIENFKQGTLDKFSLGAEQVRMRHPRLVLMSIELRLTR
jgi:crotonobetainyl-CoA:carnitine CoA-transferase CaiB-like acyl-CoA transferase